MVERHTPLSAQIVRKIDEIVTLLRQEEKEHGEEPWDTVCRRVGAKTNTSISLVDARRSLLDAGPIQSDPPHGNTHFRTAIEDCMVVVTCSEPDIWKLSIRPWQWDLPEECKQISAASRSELPHLTNQGEASSVSGEQVQLADGSRAKVEIGGQHNANVQFAKPPNGPVAPIYNEAVLIHEFDRRERERGPIFAGFIVKDLLPRMGFDTTDAKRILRAMEAQDKVRSERKANPEKPERTTTFITLNREHPDVARILTGAKRVDRKFPIGTIDGEPLSERIIRERR